MKSIKSNIQVFKYSSIQVFKNLRIQVFKYRVYKMVTTIITYYLLIINVRYRDPIGSKNACIMGLDTKHKISIIKKTA